jgi:hypothetical protein
MAYTSIELEAPVDIVDDVLIDATAYPRWLIGASDILEVDERWPEPGSRFHHRVGAGPFKLSDSTVVLAREPRRLLTLAVRARPLISAVVTFRLVADERLCALSWEEEPAPRMVGNLVRPLLDPLTHLRNHRSLRRLAAVVTEQVAAGGRQAPAGLRARVT